MQRNHLLNRLRRKDRQQLAAVGIEVELCSGDVLWESNRRIRHVFFPLDCLASLEISVDSHECLELAMVGNDGMLGVPVVLGVNTSTLKAVVQTPGTALRLTTASFRRALDNIPALRPLLHRYSHVKHAQLAITAACIRFHALDLRLARLLLATHDRAGKNSFYLTHSILAQLLGVRRVGVTNAAGLMQKRRLLSYSRGEITILNPAGLEQASCACYRTSKDVYQDILGSAPS